MNHISSTSNCLKFVYIFVLSQKIEYYGAHWYICHIEHEFILQQFLDENIKKIFVSAIWQIILRFASINFRTYIIFFKLKIFTNQATLENCADRS